MVVVDTIPPPKYLEMHAKAFGSIDDLFIELNKATTSAAIATHIRTMLNHVVDLAILWDQNTLAGQGPIIYRANVMPLYTKSLDRELEKFLCFAEPGDVSSYLEVSSDLSTTSQNDPKDIDDAISPMTLRAHAPDLSSATEQPGKPSGIIPGAPYALWYQKAQWIQNTERFWDILKSDKSMLVHKDAIENYYEADTKGRSILSIPLPPAAIINTSDLAPGCLNIYRDEPGIFGNDRRAQQFASLMVPICRQISYFLNVYIAVEEAEP